MTELFIYFTVEFIYSKYSTERVCYIQFNTFDINALATRAQHHDFRSI